MSDFYTNKKKAIKETEQLIKSATIAHGAAQVKTLLFEIKRKYGLSSAIEQHLDELKQHDLVLKGTNDEGIEVVEWIFKDDELPKQESCLEDREQTPEESEGNSEE